LDDLQSGLLRCVKQSTRDRTVAWRNLSGRLLRVRPAQLLHRRRESLVMSQRRLRELMQAGLRDGNNRLTAVAGRLRLLGPEQVLARGYSITQDEETGKILRRAREATVGRVLRTKLQEGEVVSRVEPRDDVRDSC
jgi:exodeoxyribonuclease VII large subunit